MTVRVIATAGHVDHGKSTLVHALTGTDPDRLAEEKRRGLTIELGFAHLSTPSGADLHLIDVPGHVRFIKTMLAGVGAVDACLLVVAATEGWKPQTEEHLRILELLGIRHGVVVVTMADRVDADQLELALLEIDERTEGTFLADVDRVVVDSVTQRGLPDLLGALDRLVAACPPREDAARARLWVDRSFTIAGAGTVVTGTLAAGSLQVEDEVEIVAEDGVRACRIRGLQSFGASVDRLDPGCRAAVNLAGIAAGEIGRGDALVQPGRWHRTGVVDASLSTLATLANPIRSGGAFVAYVGSGEHAVRLRLLGSTRVEAGESALVRLTLPRPLPLLPGDRYVLRDSGSATTVGGGEVLDVAPALRPSKARPDRSVERVIAERRWVAVDELERLTGVARSPVVGRWVVDPDALDQAQDDLRLRVAAAAPRGLDVATLDERERALIDAGTDIVVTAGRARFRAAPDPYPSHPYLNVLAAAPFAPPSPAESGVSDEEVRELVRRGLAVQADGIVLAASAVERAAPVIADLLRTTPDGVSVSDLRTALGTTRRFAIALLSATDQRGITRRRGDLRIAGPRLERAS